MEYRRLGSSGLNVSEVGLGTNNFGGRINQQQTTRVLQQAIDLGINFIDTADIYGGGLSEEFIGKGLSGRRHDVLLATKVGGSTGQGANDYGASRQHIMGQVEVSLRRLDTDYIDLYQIHFPDPGTPIDETMRALDDLVREGKVRYVGCSNFFSWQICEALWTSRIGNQTHFVSVQPEYSLVNRDIEREVLPFCRAYQVGVIPYFPLASGFLTGKYRSGEAVPEGTRFSFMTAMQDKYMTDRNFVLLERLEGFAQERGHTVGELAIAWLLANHLVSSVIAGATTTEQVVVNANSSDWRLTSEDMADVLELITQSETPRL
jgi:aryl-alcohol dehydrogenase-like predicted oxidoreductase